MPILDMEFFLEKIIRHCANNHYLTNLIFVLILLGGCFAWLSIRKEEMPEFESNWLSIRASYPGARSEDVEKLVIHEIEKRIKGISGIDTINSTAASGSANISIILQNGLKDKQVVVQSIREAALNANLPNRVRETIRVRQWKNTEKAIIDIALTHTEQHLLNFEGRDYLQSQVRVLENQLLNSSLLSSVSRSGYYDEEILIALDPNKLTQYELSSATVAQKIRSENIRLPAGNLEDRLETKVSLVGQLDSPDKLENLVIKSTLTGKTILLKDLATVSRTHKKNNIIRKVNGNEAIILNIKKAFDADIIDAQKETLAIVEKFKESRPNSPIMVKTLDDESYTVRNRLNLIVSNGALGFILILLSLFIFLDLRSGFWVAMGIPFCLAFTLIAAHLMGYTVNNMTLAAIIIVLGIVVDDAIIVAERIFRRRSEGDPEPTVSATKEVFVPIFVSILTTCIAFLPFYFFHGRFASFVVYIPSIVTLMLVASLFESTLILPSHLHSRKKKKPKSTHWFMKIESLFSKFLTPALKFRYVVITISGVLLAGSLYLFNSDFKFVLFPSEESREIFVRVKGPTMSAELKWQISLKKLRTISFKIST